MDQPFCLVIGGPTVGDYDRKWFRSFDEAMNAHDNLPTRLIGHCRIEIQRDEFFWEIDPLGSKHRPFLQIPI